MTDPAPNRALAERFAALVSLVSDEPSVVSDQRAAAHAVTQAARDGSVTLALRDGALLAGDAPFDAPLLAARFAAYGIEELGITERAAQADLLDLARMLAAPPAGADPAARFAGRAAALDARTLPRRLRSRAEADAAASPVPAVRPAPRSSGASRSVTPSAVPPVAPRRSGTSTPEMPAVAGQERPAPAVGAPGAVSTPAAPEPAPRDAPERLVEALSVPETSQQSLASARHALERAESTPQIVEALERLVSLGDLAFRQGRHADLVEALTTLVALEFEFLERDSSDERRQALNHAVRQLARPQLLRQLAVLRHSMAGDAVAASRLQQVLYRFGVDAAEAVIDEYFCAPTGEARAVCLDCLRGLRRTYDALHAAAGDTNEGVVRQAAVLLGELRDPRGDTILIDLLQRGDERVRRTAIAAVASSMGEGVLEAIVLALADESPRVRMRAVAAMTGRREAQVLQGLHSLIDVETEREVLLSAIGALGSIGTPEAVQALIRVAEGEGPNPQRRNAAMRIQACTALVAIRTPLAMAAVQKRRDDKDREVREAAVRLLAQARRVTTSSVAVVSVP